MVVEILAVDCHFKLHVAFAGLFQLQDMRMRWVDAHEVGGAQGRVGNGVNQIPESKRNKCGGA